MLGLKLNHVSKRGHSSFNQSHHTYWRFGAASCALCGHPGLGLSINPWDAEIIDTSARSPARPKPAQVSRGTGLPQHNNRFRLHHLWSYYGFYTLSVDATHSLMTFYDPMMFIRIHPMTALVLVRIRCVNASINIRFWKYVLMDQLISDFENTKPKARLEQFDI